MAESLWRASLDGLLNMWTADDPDEEQGGGQAPVITTASLTTGVIGTSYSKTMAASGTAPITWTAVGLPSGLVMSSGGTISGTPIVAGSFNVTITASNGYTPNAVETFSLPINVSTVSGTYSPWGRYVK